MHPAQSSALNHDLSPLESAFRSALDLHPIQDYPALPGRTNHLGTGILVPILEAEDPTVILTVRDPGLRRHAGEVAFPGGRPDPGDTDLQATALREAREECGISRVRVLGRLSSMPLYTSDFRLYPFVGLVPPDESLVPQPGEVAHILRVRLLDWMTRASLPAIAFEWQGETAYSPIFDLEGHLMYGATAHTFYELMQVAARALHRTLPPFSVSALSWEDILAGR